MHVSFFLVILTIMAQCAELIHMLFQTLVSTPTITYTLCKLDCDLEIEGIYEALCIHVVKDGDMIVAAKSIVLYQQIVLAFAIASFFGGVVLSDPSCSFGHIFSFCTLLVGV